MEQLYLLTRKLQRLYASNVTITDALLGPGVNPLEGSPNVKLRKLGPKSGGGLEVCSRLGLEASWETGFKRETWNVG